MKENFNLLCEIVSRISIRSWEEWIERFSNLFNKILYDLKPGIAEVVTLSDTTSFIISLECLIISLERDSNNMTD